jgi:hypothetical protein
VARGPSSRRPSLLPSKRLVGTGRTHCLDLQSEPADDTGVARFGIIAVAVLALASGGFGYVALGAAGVCDTSCPSDTAVVVYRVMYNAGFAVFVACVAFWNWRRNRRR